MSQSDAQSSTVFVIDDDDDVRASIAGLLKSVGLRAETFESAQEFLSREHSDGPGCLVLDFALPSMNGFEVQRELSDAGVRIPIIFISGYGDTGTSAHAIESGAVEFLTKPFQDQDLLDAIQKALNRDRMTRQNHASVPTESPLAAFSQSVLSSVESGRTPMATELRKSGIDVVGDMVAWGAHFCLFYETKEDLLDTLTSYCRSGLERGEYCLWIVADPLTIEEAKGALKREVPDIDRHLADSRMEMVRARDWFLKGGTFDGKSLTQDWYDKLARVSARGYPGMRVTGDTTWLSKKDWRHFCDYEDGLNEVIGNQRLAVLCTYPLTQCGAPQILDVVKTHQFVLARRHGNWDVVETATLKQAKSEIKLLNEELEQRVVERTGELMKASDALREAQTELAHINRVTAMGQLAASIVHETMQPISAAVTNAHAALRSLSSEPPDLGAVREAIDRIIKNGSRASDVIGRLRALSKKAPPLKDSLEVNEAVLDVIALTRGEVVKNGISLRTELADGLPRIQADRVQLQQVILNLVMNAVEAMSDVRERPRALLVGTERDATGGVIVRVTDSGPGVSSESVDRVFEAFYTTKPRGMGMGLSICRTIVEAHGGRIWASRAAGLGATLQFALPAA
jgi:signal transduction histidine kinase/FixJ family two-component response regulator